MSTTSHALLPSFTDQGSLPADSTMPPEPSGTSASQSRGRSASPAIGQSAHERVISHPTSITLIKPQRCDIFGDKFPKGFMLVVKCKGGETLRESKWDLDRGGWPVDIVQIRGSATENLSIELRELRFSGLVPWTIANGSLTVKEVESAIHASQEQLNLPIAILSRYGLSATDKKLDLIVEISTPSLVPIWITSIALAEPVADITDQTLKNLDLVFKSQEGKTLKNSSWDLSRRIWDVNLPQ
ncbi:hypothetical protein V5O48_017887, partial [Marasmius crinis-equi]